MPHSLFIGPLLVYQEFLTPLATGLSITLIKHYCEIGISHVQQ